MRKLFLFIPVIFFFIGYPLFAKYSGESVFLAWHYLTIFSCFIAIISVVYFLTCYFFIAIQYAGLLLIKEKIHVEQLEKIDSILSEQETLRKKINTITSPVHIKRL